MPRNSNGQNLNRWVATVFPALCVLLASIAIAGPAWAKAPANVQYIIRVGHPLLPGHRLLAKSGSTSLVFTRRGELIEYHKSKTVVIYGHRSSLRATRKMRLALSPRGTLALTNGQHRVWSRRLATTGLSHVTLEASGRIAAWHGKNLVRTTPLTPAHPATAPVPGHSSPVSSSLMAPTPAPAPAPASAPASPPAVANTYTSVGQTLVVGAALAAGQELTSANGAYTVVMQHDGNLVEYGTSGALWASSTVSGDGSTATLQADGDFLVASSSGAVGWESATSTSHGDQLTLQDDGNLVLYSAGHLPLWSSQGGHTSDRVDILGSGNSMHAGQSIISASGAYSAIMQGDGNFVEYGPAGVVWASGTSVGDGSSYLILQGDGNLVIYADGSQVKWASGSSGGAMLVMQDDGNLVLYNGVAALWASKGIASAGTSTAAPSDDYPTVWRNAAQDSMVDSWREYNRECTSFVAWRLSSRNHFEMPFHDNASGWSADASARGYRVDHIPAVGSVAWSSSGHVAWVQAVSGSQVTIEEYNYHLNGTYDSRSVSANSFTGYIHFADL